MTIREVKSSEPRGTTPAPSTPKQRFEIQRIYVKERHGKLSRSPQLFKEEWKAQMEMEIQLKSDLIEENLYEVLLQVQLTAKNNQITAFTAEVQQAGIFVVEGFEEKERQHLLNAYAPNLLYPHLAKVISDMSVEASLAPILLQPMNFEALYLQQQKAEAEKAVEGVH